MSNLMHESPASNFSTVTVARRRLTFRKRLVFSLVACGLLYLVTELAAFVILLYSGESWSRVHEQMQTVAARNPLRPGGEFSLPVMVHPYIGYVLQQDSANPDKPVGEKYRITDYGFIDDQPPIHRRSADRVIVAIVGGSVARQMAMTATSVLEEELSQHPAMTGKKFTFVRMAIDGHKQPQQLMAISYFLTQRAEFDIVINLDGVNDAALPQADNVSSGVAASYPRQWGSMLSPWTSQEVSRQVGYITYLRTRECDMAAFFLHRLPFWSPVVQLIWKVGDQRAEQQIHEETKKIVTLRASERSLATSGPAESFASQDALFEHCIDTWAKSSELLARLCSSQGTRYFHFLQPNQYVPDSKTLTDDEKSKAINEASPFRIPVMSCFPMMRKRGEQLRRAGVMFTDLTTVFVDHPESIYKDDCCHVTDAGDAIMARAIAREIRQSWDQSKPASPMERFEPNRER